MAENEKSGQEYRGGAPEGGEEAKARKGDWAESASGVTPDYSVDAGDEQPQDEQDMKDAATGAISEGEEADVNREAGDQADATTEWSEATEGGAPAQKDPTAPRRQSEGASGQ